MSDQVFKAHRWQNMAIRNGTNFTKYFQRNQIGKWLQVLFKLPWVGNKPRHLCFYNTCADANDKYLCSPAWNSWVLAWGSQLTTENFIFKILEKITLKKLLLVYEDSENKHLNSINKNQIYRFLKKCASHWVSF